MNQNGKDKHEIEVTEVEPSAQRRQYSKTYKQRILEEIEAAREPGEVGAILRREGLYTQLISKWRAQRQAGFPGTGARRGPAADPQAREIARLQRENERLRKRLARAELVLEVQKKVSQMVGLGEHEEEALK
jgi:transposase-like protein